MRVSAGESLVDVRGVLGPWASSPPRRPCRRPARRGGGWRVHERGASTFLLSEPMNDRPEAGTLPTLPVPRNPVSGGPRAARRHTQDRHLARWRCGTRRARAGVHIVGGGAGAASVDHRRCSADSCRRPPIRAGASSSQPASQRPRSRFQRWWARGRARNQDVAGAVVGRGRCRSGLAVRIHVRHGACPPRRTRQQTDRLKSATPRASTGQSRPLVRNVSQ